MQATSQVERTTPPAVFLILMLPFGATAGYLTVALTYLLKHSGVSTAGVGNLIAVATAPQVLKVLWAPLIDTAFTVRGWYLASAIVMAVAVAISGMVPLGPGCLSYLAPIAFLLSIAVSFLGMAAEALMAHGTPPEKLGAAGGWSQAGSIGGVGLGGGAGLWLAIHVPPMWISSTALGVMIMLCALALTLTVEPSHDHRHPDYRESLARVGREAWGVARSRAGAIAILMFGLPLASSAAGRLLAAIAGDWKASADLVALVSGVAGGLCAALGALIGGALCDRINRKAAFALYSVVQSACALGLALSPRTPVMFAVFALAYAVSSGLAYAGFAALTLETIGRGAAATKYNLLAACSNMPLVYMALIEGALQTRFGSSAMLGGEAALAFGSLCLVGLITVSTRPRAAPA